MKPKNLRAIPAVEKVLQALGEPDIPRPALVALVRRELAALRKEKRIPESEAILAGIRAAVERLRRGRLQPLINGTGILIHTNLGRAPLGPAVVEALGAIAANYNNLEYDLSGGERGGRAGYLEHNLALLCGAELATVVNNGAAALVLILRHFAAGPQRDVIISRGELIQIGGGFRIPPKRKRASRPLPCGEAPGKATRASLGTFLVSPARCGARCRGRAFRLGRVISGSAGRGFLVTVASGSKACGRSYRESV